MADHRDGQDFSLGKNAVEIVDVDGGKGEAGLALAEVKEAAFERGNFFSGAASAFGEDDQRGFGAHAFDEVVHGVAGGGEGVRRVGAVGVSGTGDQNCIEDVDGKSAAKA